jgi:CheY-like chemotaxis protein
MESTAARRASSDTIFLVCRVLVVEDDDVIRESMSELLALEGFDVIAAANGREALELVRAGWRPCAVLLDLFMPVMDGWQFLAEIERDRELADLPITIVSAAGDRLSGVGGRRILRKPVSLHRLLAAVHASCPGHLDEAEATI